MPHDHNKIEQALEDRDVQQEQDAEDAVGRDLDAWLLAIIDWDDGT